MPLSVAVPLCVCRVHGVLIGDVELIIIKVFDTANCGWTYTSTLINAMQVRGACRPCDRHHTRARGSQLAACV